MIVTYNKEHVGDVLMVTLAPNVGIDVTCTRVEDVAKITKNENGALLGLNFFNASHLLPTLGGCGNVSLNKEEIMLLNKALESAGFSDRLPLENRPTLVVGYVKELVPHPDSDHLSITQMDLGHGELLQIVCGAKNIKQGQKVVVATNGHMMPDGSLIWNGELRGEKSFGMICSAKELHLPNAPKEKGILVLDDSAVVGEAFDAQKHWNK